MGSFFLISSPANEKVGASIILVTVTSSLLTVLSMPPDIVTRNVHCMIFWPGEGGGTPVGNRRG